MDVSEIIASLDDHGFSETDTTRKVDSINDAYFDVAHRYPWPFLKARATVAWDNGNSRLTTTSGIGTPLSVRDSTNHRFLRQVAFEEVQTLYHNPNLTGPPQVWYWDGTNIFAVPLPSSGNFDVVYLRTPTELTSGSVESAILIPARHHRVLVVGALFRLYNLDDEPEMAQVFNVEYESRIDNMAKELLNVPPTIPVRNNDSRSNPSSSG